MICFVVKMTKTFLKVFEKNYKFKSVLIMKAWVFTKRVVSYQSLFDQLLSFSQTPFLLYFLLHVCTFYA